MYGDLSWTDTAGRLLIVLCFLVTGLCNLTKARIKDHIDRMAAYRTPFPALVFWIGIALQFTGCARNIGRAISRSLAAGGATVMVNANTSQGDAKNTVAMIKSNGGAAAFHFADVTDPDAVAKMVDATVKQFGRLDILVNNAAVRSETHFEDIKLEEWRRVIATVLDGAFLCTQSCLPHLIRVRGGSIVNIGGLTAHKGATNRAHVIAAKAGIAGMTRALALELAPRRITVHCVVPGTIETVRGLPGAPARPRDRRGLPPVGRRGEP